MAGVAAGFGTMNDHTITIGEREGWGESRRFGISDKDQRQHLYIIGKTGSGKTTLLRNLILQHIALGCAAAIVLMHNHPSGDPTPSEADIKVTRDLIRAGQLLKIEVLDHVIMGNPGRSSLREAGYFA